MSTTEKNYRWVCDQVWSLYQAQVQKETPRRSKRKALLPPPPRGKPVDLLFVGISPSQVVKLAYQNDPQAAERFAAEFEYISEGASRGPEYRNDAYYGPLVQFARRLDDRFGVWRQVERGEKSLSVEFTDALHITTDHRIPDDLLCVMNPQAEACPVCAKCKEILEAELVLYQPRVVVCNGRLPSKFMWEICTGQNFPTPPAETFLKHTRLGCNVHLSGYLII